MSQKTENIMKKIILEKVVLNMGMGKSGDAVELAKRALEQISNKKPNAREAKATQRDWGIRQGEPIGAAVTIRGKDAKELLTRLLQAKGNRINGRSFDNFGNFSFGIREHIDIPGVKYDPQIGIVGLDIAVTLERPGFNIRRRSKHKARIGKNHQITKRDAQDFMEKQFGAIIA